MQIDTCSFLLRHDAPRTTNCSHTPSSTAPRRLRREAFSCRPQQHFRHEPSHKAWLLCNIGKQSDFSTLGSAFLLTEQETFLGSTHFKRASCRAGGRTSIPGCL